MNRNKYCEIYIDCYNKIIDIVYLIKEFLYPGQYEIERFSEDMDMEDKLINIKNDLENIAFTEEVDYSLTEFLDHFYPSDEIDYQDYHIDELVTLKENKLDVLHDSLKAKYLPFIKSITIEQYPDKEDTKLSKEEIWQLALDSDIDGLEEKVEEIIWTIMDSKSNDLIDRILKDAYYLDDIEYNRYIAGEKIEESSIKRTVSNVNKINCDFNNFKTYFEDIYGQNKALITIEKVLKRSLFLFNADDIKATKKVNGPLATFMFYGPTGTGKTECSKRIAEFVFKDDKKILILDMNSYKDGKIGASAIKGHPEGYVNSEKGTDFTRFLKNNRNGIIVLDEFEKADREVREIFMTMLDEGEFKDALGNVYNLSSYIFIATTNASERFESVKKTSIGFGAPSKEEIEKSNEKDIKEGLREIFSAPIMNRFNNLVHFKKIEYNDALDISKSLISKLCSVFENKIFKGITPKITIENIDDICEIILNECDYEKDGVRSMKNVINDLIGSNIIEQILAKNTNITIYCEDGEIQIKGTKEIQNAVKKH